MKIIVKVLLFSLVTILMVQQDLKSQNCDDCLNTSWSGPSTVNVDGRFPGVVTYYTKFCNGKWLIRIDNITSQTNSDMIKTHQSILFEIITTNPMLLPPMSEQDGEIEWNIIRKMCWKYKEFSNNSVQEPCDPVECCVTKVLIKKKNNCGYVSTIIGQNGVVGNCPIFGTGAGTQNCINTCIPIEPNVGN